MRTLVKILGVGSGVLALAAIGFFVFPEKKVKDASVSGLSVRSEHWSGTIRVTGDINITPLKTLTIEPGTRILFEKDPDIEGTDWTNYADAYIKDHDDPTGREGYNDSHFHLFGKIIARGNAEQPIVFTSAQEQPEYADWDQLILLGGSELDFVEVSYAHNGVNISGENVRVTNSTVHDSLWSCVDIFSKNTTIENNEIYHCWHQAIGVKKESPNMIQNNTIHDALLAVNCEYGATPTIQNNTFEGAPTNPDCPIGTNNTETIRDANVAGGTYNGKLIYPANNPPEE
ncbi:MAG: right-handed parallel beta-helix repeat-containing protein [Candidatus Kerfeldbacteria bacterium]|nr:right-handed parallel beta-helix repeat-containing protein [Candidatus Kerfeldbacteria bacterium]